jgi:TRAP transporter TAXI family solute receptor
MFVFICVGCSQQTSEKSGTETTPESESQDQETKVTYDWIIGGSTTGHTIYQISVAYSDIINKVPGFTATVEDSGGGYDGIELLMAEDLDCAGVGIIAVNEMYNGLARYEGKANKNICSFIPTYPGPVQIIVLENSSIKSIADLKGKRVGTMPIGAANHSVNKAVLEAAGLTENDYKEYAVEIKEMVDAIKNGTLDAAMITTGAPTPDIMELRATHKIRFIPVEPEIAEKAHSINPSVFPGTIPANCYEGQTEEIPTVLTYTIMATRTDLPEDVVYVAIKSIWENQDVLKNAHASQRGISPQWFLDVDKCVPFHPGVKKFIDEMGWK